MRRGRQLEDSTCPYTAVRGLGFTPVMRDPCRFTRNGLFEQQGYSVRLTIDSIMSREETSWSGLREVSLLALPIMITVGSNTLMNAVDTLMVAQLGREYIAAIVPASILNGVIVAFFVGVVSCVSTFVGQSYGREDYRECSRFAWQGIYVALIIAIGVLVLWSFTPLIFRLAGHEPRVQELESLYFRYRLFGVGGAIMSVALGAFFQATGRPAVPMLATILANIVNLVGCYALIFGKFGFPKLGLAGSAIASNVAAWLCALMMLVLFLSKEYKAIYHTWTTWKWDGPRARQFFSVGWPAGLSLGLDTASWAVFIGLIIGRFGTDCLAAGSIVGVIMLGSFMPTVGLGIAVTALVGQWIGRRKPERAITRYKAALKLGAAYMTVMGVLFVLFRHELVGFFRSEPEIVELGGKFLIFGAAFQFLNAIGIVTSGALKGAGDTKWPLMAGIAAAWGIFLPLGYVLSTYTTLGVFGGWLGATVYIYLLGAALFWRFISGKWQRINLFGLAADDTEKPGEKKIAPEGPTKKADERTEPAA